MKISNEHIQENITDVAYGELGRGENVINTWGVANYNGVPKSLYWDKDINREIFTKEILKRADKSKPVRIVDFGGAEGKLLREIFDDLRKNNIEPLGAVIDTQLEKGKTKDAWDKYRFDNPGARDKIIAISANFVENEDDINLHQESVDFAISRFVAQYNWHTLSKFFSEQAEYLKSGGTLICEWPAATENDEQLINEFWPQYAGIVDGVDPSVYSETQYYPTVKKIKEVAESVGLKNVDCNLVDGLTFDVSEIAISNGSRFKKMDERQKAELRDLFINMTNKFPNLVSYDEKNNRYYYRMSVGKLVAEKI